MKSSVRVRLRFAAVSLVAFQLSCGGGDGPVAVPVATTMSANSAATQNGTAGAPVATLPSVTVRDQNGNPMAGVAVSFAVASGSGSVAGASVVTNASGIATVGGWTLGATTGTNTLSASAVGVTPVLFTATAGAGAASSITKTAGDNQSGEDGSPVPIAPAVTVTDAGGNPVPGVTVTFAIASGLGTVTGGTQVTNASGVATVGSWSLGPANPNRLTATTGALTAQTFTATATPRAACNLSPQHTIGSNTNGQLTSADCRFDNGSFVDFYSTTIAAAGAYTFGQTGTGFDPVVVLYGPDGIQVAVNDDESPTSQQSRIGKALLPAGNFRLAATAFTPGATGSYTLSSGTTSSAITNCEDVFIARGVTTDQVLQTTDCLFNNLYSDDMLIFIPAGQTVVFTMNSTSFDAYLELYGPAGLITSNDDRDSTTDNAQITYTSTTTGFYLIAPTSRVTLTIGAYTLIVQ